LVVAFVLRARRDDEDEDDVMLLTIEDEWLILLLRTVFPFEGRTEDERLES
jgi:hypothetical protein